jgi:alcohol dehydrogenase (cytochrome c)
MSLAATLPPIPAPDMTRPSLPQGVAPDDAVRAVAKQRAERLQKIQPVTDEMLRHPPDGDWINPRRTYDSQGFSPLAQINRGNVAKLEMGWVWELPPSKNEITPLVHDGIMFVPSGAKVQALDAVTGDLLWTYTHPTPVGAVRNLGIYGDKIYFAAETDMVALDVRSGSVVWKQPIVTPGYGMRLATGPLIVKGVVLQPTGYCTGPYPGGCFIVGLDAATGKELWRFHTIARPGQPGGDTWNNTPVDDRYGGGVWIPPSYEPDLDLVYFGTGQTYRISSLLKNYNGLPGGNDALYTDSTVALRPLTGELVWHYQHMSRDVWDLDWAFEQTLATLMIDGKPRRTITTGSKLSIFDTIDAATGEYLFSYDTGVQNLVTSIDPKTGAKTVNPALVPEPNVTKSYCTSPIGGRDWPATAFNPQTGILYVPQNELCSEMTWVPGPSFEITSRIQRRFNSDGMVGRIDAIDLATRKTIWVQRRRAPQSSAILGTAGGLIFEGSRDRVFRASDERTGKVLWQTRLNAPPSSYPITYSVNGVQYVAVVAGGGNTIDVMPGSIITPEIAAPSNGMTLWIFRLPGKR